MKVHMTLRRSYRGFSLIELLFVITIVSVLASLGVPAFRGMTASSDLVNGANLVGGLMNQARIYAIANNTQSAVYLCTDWPGNTDRSLRAASVWAYDADRGRWIQTSKWELLPKGIVFQLNTPSALTGIGHYYALDAATLNNSITPALVVNGQAVGVSEIRFNALGVATIPKLGTSTSIQQVTLRLIPGVLQAGALQQTNAENWMDVRTDGLTGRVSFVQR